MYSFPASTFTHVVILFSMTAPLWYTYLTFKKTAQKALALSTLCLLWGALMFGVVRYGWIQSQFDLKGALPVVTLAIPVGLSILFRKQLLGKGLSQHWLVGLQVFRVIGMVFLIELSSGYISPSFAHPAGWGDILVGLVALYVVIRYRSEEIPRSAIIAVASLGIIDFIGAFGTGILSSAGPLQMMSFDLPNQVTLYPTGMIPFFLVPYASIFHVLSLSQMQKDASSSAS